MKKYLLLSAAAFLMATQANAYDLNPYIGMDLGGAHVKAAGKKLDGSSNVAVANINVGVKFNPYFGLELSSQGSSDSDIDNLGDLSYSSIGLDAVGYVPLNYQWQLLGMAGLGYYDFDIELDHKVDGWDIHYSRNKTAFRAGLGLQYELNDKWAIRGLARYHHIDNDYFDYIADYMIGLKYKF